MKERILQVATQLFTERGYHGMSMRVVAERCSVTKAALYYHFSSKESLFLAVLENYLEETARAMDQARLSAESAGV